MDFFWAGFYKKAASSLDTKDCCVPKLDTNPIDEWQHESEEADKASHKGSGGAKVDPVTIAQSFTPDTYWRSWP